MLMAAWLEIELLRKFEEIEKTSISFKNIIIIFICIKLFLYYVINDKIIEYIEIYFWIWRVLGIRITLLKGQACLVHD